MSFLGYFGISFEETSITCLLLSVLIGVYVIYLRLHYAGTPPGPWGLPLFGYLLFFTKKPFEDFARLGKKYGNVFSVKIGSRYVVVLNDYEDIQATFVKRADIYSGKSLDGMAAEKMDYKSLIVTDGKIARIQRPFLLSSLRDFGFGKKRMEERIQEEAELIINEFVKNANGPVEIEHLIAHGVTNIIGCLLFGQRFHYDDKEIMKSINLMSELLALQSQFTFLDAFPKLQYFIPSSLFGLRTFEKMKKQMYDFIEIKINEHKETFDANNIRDVIDTYLLKREQSNSTGPLSPDNVFNDEYMRANALMLFTAGTETSTTTLSWALKLLAINPDIQTQIQREIDEVIGHERQPIMADKIKMPFTEATLLEVNRVISLIPLGFYRRVTEDTVLNGYKIPKNTLVIANLWNIHHTTDIWKDPFQFNPRRFLDSDGKINGLREYVTPFSAGKRSCLGESLAKMELFLFLTCFLQKLTFLSSHKYIKFDIKREIPLRKLNSCILSIKMRH